MSVQIRPPKKQRPVLYTVSTAVLYSVCTLVTIQDVVEPDSGASTIILKRARRCHLDPGRPGTANQLRTGNPKPTPGGWSHELGDVLVHTKVDQHGLQMMTMQPAPLIKSIGDAQVMAYVTVGCRVCAVPALSVAARSINYLKPRRTSVIQKRCWCLACFTGLVDMVSEPSVTVSIKYLVFQYLPVPLLVHVYWYGIHTHIMFKNKQSNMFPGTSGQCPTHAGAT